MRNRSSHPVDPLSNWLDVLDVRCELSGKLVAGGDWAQRFGSLDAIKFCAATEGACWYFMDGLAGPALFEAGDVLVTNGVRPLILASAPGSIDDASTAPPEQDEDGQYRLGRGSSFSMLAGIVQIDADRRALLQSGLPPLVHIRSATKEAAPLLWLLEQLVMEMNATERPGRTIVTAGLTQLLFVQTLRAYMIHAPTSDKAWLKGFGDRRLVLALSAIHNDPARNWSLDELARKATMSRTSFAVRFREMMGVPPLTYLTQWRMQLARRQLRSGASISEAAIAVGYRSESAFSSAFKRFMDMAPGQYRRAARETNVGLGVSVNES